MARSNQMPQLKLTADILSAALEGFESQKKWIDAQIAEIRQMLDGRVEQESQAEPATPKRKVSATARRRMARAQRLRWKKIKGAAEAKAPKVETSKTVAGTKKAKALAAAASK